MSTTIFETAVLQFHTDKMPFDLFENSELIENNFGILTIKPNKCDPITVPIVIQCTIDISSSMTEPCEYRRDNSKNKIDFIKETLKKMLPYLLENFHMEIWIQIGLFNTTYTTLIPMQILLQSNLETLLETIDSIRCSECTNIEDALKKSSTIMKTSIDDNPEFKRLHIFLTDGNPTAGSGSVHDLEKLISSEYPTLFIGYGEDHNSRLLKGCANKLLHSYQYVDNFEITGQVYAEMLYSLIYSAVEKPIIIIESGQIYDALNDIWTNRLEIPSFISEKEYIYHIISTNTRDTLVHIYDNNNNLLEMTPELPSLMNEDGTLDILNLDKYIFKQKTMELLSGILKVDDSDDIDRMDIIKRRKHELAEFYRLMRKYMRENEVTEDPFMKVLCEDLYISYQTANTNYAEMNILSRLNAQATQGLYRSGSSNNRRQNVINDYSQNMGIQRMASNNIYQEEYIDEEYAEETQIDEHSNTAITQLDDIDSIENYQDDFVTQNIYSPCGMEQMGRIISS